MSTTTTPTKPAKTKRGMARWKKIAIGGGLAVHRHRRRRRVVVPPRRRTEGRQPRRCGRRRRQRYAATASTDGVAGDWTVDTSVGQFSFEDSTGTFVGFRVSEELSGIGSTTAVGRTPAVSGTMTIDGTTLTATNIVRPT